MQVALLHPPSQSVDQPSSGDVEVLLANARLLQRASEPGPKQQLLKGKHLGLLTDAPEAHAATLFVRAATELGALVSHIRPSLSDLATQSVCRDTSQMLGRLYDGIECQGLPAQLAQQIGREAGIPVYGGIATEDHPTASLASLLAGDEADECKRQLLLQAVMLATLR
jgi:ornithine carbamoyltransferase